MRAGEVSSLTVHSVLSVCPACAARVLGVRGCACGGVQRGVSQVGGARCGDERPASAAGGQQRAAAAGRDESVGGRDGAAEAGRRARGQAASVSDARQGHRLRQTARDAAARRQVATSLLSPEHRHRPRLASPGGLSQERPQDFG